MRLPADATLIVIDAQEAIGDPRPKPRDRSDAETKIVALMAAWRAEGLPIVLVRPASIGSGAPDAPDPPGQRFEPWAAPPESEWVIGRSADSAFAGTDLEALLDDIGATTLVLCGALTPIALEATARDAGSLGYAVFVVTDACRAADASDRTGGFRPDDDANARIVDAATALNAAATAKARQRHAAKKA